MGCSDVPWSPDAGAPVDGALDAAVTQPPSDANDVAPDGPDTPVPEGPLMVEASSREPEVETFSVFSGPVDSAASLGVDDVLFTHEGNVWWRSGEDAPVLVADALAPTHLAAAVGDGLALLATQDGLMSVTAEQAVLSPLSSALAGEDIVDLEVVVTGEDGWDIWLATDTRLWLWRNNLVTPVQLEGRDLAGADVAFGASYEGAPGLWVSAGGELLALVPSADGLQAWPIRDDRDFSSLACDASGRLWALADGDVFRREVDGRWSWFRLPQPATTLKARDGAWVTTSDAVWYASADGAWFSIVQQSRRLLEVDVADRALLASETSVQTYQVDAPEPPPEETLTWSQHIAPLFQNHCAQCHGPGKFAHALHTKEQWVAELDTILTSVTGGFMPLPPNPPLSEDQVEQIITWQQQGFN